MLRALILIATFIFAANASSQNIMRFQAPIKYVESWIPVEDTVSDWLTINSPYDCVTWIPNVSEVSNGVAFTQAANDCKIDQERTITQRMKLKNSEEFKIINKYIESRTVTGQYNTRTALGTKVLIPPSSITVKGVGVFYKPTKLPDGRVFYMFEKHINVLDLGSMFGVQIHYIRPGRISRTIDGKTITLGITEDLVDLFNYLKLNNQAPYGNTGYWTNSWHHKIGSIPTLVAVSPSGSINYAAGSVGTLGERPVIVQIQF